MTSPAAPDDTARPLVSVIVPFLNAGRFLREAIESIRAQTYTRWELILVDDGSTDGTEAVDDTGSQDDIGSQDDTDAPVEPEPLPQDDGDSD